MSLAAENLPLAHFLAGKYGRKVREPEAVLEAASLAVAGLAANVRYRFSGLERWTVAFASGRLYLVDDGCVHREGHMGSSVAIRDDEEESLLKAVEALLAVAKKGQPHGGWVVLNLLGKAREKHPELAEPELRSAYWALVASDQLRRQGERVSVR